MKTFLRNVIPSTIWLALARVKRGFIHGLLRRVLGAFPVCEYLTARELIRCGLNSTRPEDYYSPLPNVTRLEATHARWLKPSELAGIPLDFKEMRQRITTLVDSYSTEFLALPTYEEIRRLGYGEGYTPIDAMVLYCMVRQMKPHRYFEVGAGISTYYCFLAGQQNAGEGRPVEITTVDPGATGKLRAIPGAQVLTKEVQDIGYEHFQELESGDILFIDSTHIVKIDGDVPHLILEALPRLKKGVIVHVHDVPFPFNVPFPADVWIFNRDWPVFWNEAMLLQAFLCHSDTYRVILSVPLLRHFDEDFLQGTIPNYANMDKRGTNTFSSIWIQRIAEG